MPFTLVELNEVNFDYVKGYLSMGEDLPTFRKLIQGGVVETTSEAEYDHLEPWIQWPSVHTGKTFSEHQIFRLGDIVKVDEHQIFEVAESHGFSVGVVCAMNSRSRLRDPSYFIPDPWTATSAHGGWLLKKIAAALRQSVNDNSEGKIAIQSIFTLAVGTLLHVSPRYWLKLISYALKSRGKSWRKALFLDLWLFFLNETLAVRRKVDFSVVFLNAGAHIQHHFFLNSALAPQQKNPSWYINEKEDPLLEMLHVYDFLLGYLGLNNRDYLIATGLSQTPYEAPLIYYRLKHHSDFLTALGVNFLDVTPRMTRDFLISCDSFEDAILAEQLLKNVSTPDGRNLFGIVDNRGVDVFVTLTFCDELDDSAVVIVDGRSLFLKDHFVFVAIKNGEHASRGFALGSTRFRRFLPNQGAHVAKLYESMCSYLKFYSKV